MTFVSLFAVAFVVHVRCEEAFSWSQFDEQDLPPHGEASQGRRQCNTCFLDSDSVHLERTIKQLNQDTLALYTDHPLAHNTLHLSRNYTVEVLIDGHHVSQIYVTNDPKEIYKYTVVLMNTTAGENTQNARGVDIGKHTFELRPLETVERGKGSFSLKDFKWKFSNSQQQPRAITRDTQQESGNDDTTPIQWSLRMGIVGGIIFGVIIVAIIVAALVKCAWSLDPAALPADLHRPQHQQHQRSQQQNQQKQPDQRSQHSPQQNQQHQRSQQHKRQQNQQQQKQPDQRSQHRNQYDQQDIPPYPQRDDLRVPPVFPQHLLDLQDSRRNAPPEQLSHGSDFLGYQQQDGPRNRVEQQSRESADPLLGYPQRDNLRNPEQLSHGSDFLGYQQQDGPRHCVLQYFY